MRRLTESVKYVYIILRGLSQACKPRSCTVHRRGGIITTLYWYALTECETEVAQQSLLQKQMDRLGLQQQTLQALHAKELHMLKERVARSERLLLLLSEEVERLDSPGCEDVAQSSVDMKKLEVLERDQRVAGPAPLGEPPAFHEEGHTLRKTPARVSEYRPTGFLKISEVNPSGRYIRIFNSSHVEKADLSGCVIQQWIGGHPVALFRFPLNTGLPPQQCVTIWASAADIPCESPSELHWREQLHFKTGPDCTTLLTRPGGQPIDWYRASHRASPISHHKENVSEHPPTQHQEPTHAGEPVTLSPPTGVATTKELSESPPLRTCPSSAPPTLRRRAWNGPASEKINPRIHSRSTARGCSWDCFPAENLGTATAVPSTAYSLSFIDGLSASSSVLPTSFDQTMAFQTRLNTRSPVVALLTQKSARSKYGFKYLSYPPFTVDVHVIRR
ncbi:lamin tail domain-containing protein 2 isoform X1 [Pleurodeles waltl]|uniref:lamin tail domain-containing protein 2 isoform X1 n=1 Tax=Pleurodeles waltl TaxID=8319 RepID=UPI00370999E7